MTSVPSSTILHFVFWSHHLGNTTLFDEPTTRFTHILKNGRLQSPRRQPSPCPISTKDHVTAWYNLLTKTEEVWVSGCPDFGSIFTGANFVLRNFLNFPLHATFLILVTREKIVNNIGVRISHRGKSS